MEVIRWAFPHKGDAEKCYRECETLSEVTPENVLNKAKDEGTELHKCFEWDDSVAGEKYRLIQARDVIRHFVVEYKKDENETHKIRSYQITTKTNHYEPTTVILEKPDEYTALLERAKAEMEAFIRRYNTLAELEAVIEEIQKLLAA